MDNFTRNKNKKCKECNSIFLVKYIKSQSQLSNKNNWGYWTDNEKYSNVYKCNNCLMSLYSDYPDKFKRLVKLDKKRHRFSQYIYQGYFKQNDDEAKDLKKDNKPSSSKGNASSNRLNKMIKNIEEVSDFLKELAKVTKTKKDK